MIKIMAGGLMNDRACLICGDKTERGVAFCVNHTPRFGDVVSFGYMDGARTTLFVGSIKLRRLLHEWAAGAKIARFWVGSDVLLLKAFPPGRGKRTVIVHRILKKITEPFIAAHWVNGERLMRELSGILPPQKMVLQHWGGVHAKTYGKFSHGGINIAYYMPREDVYARWVYGIDLIEELQERYKNALHQAEVNFILLDGKMDMADIFPYLDAYIRPSRWDGWPRLVQECKINDVPFYYSDDGKPSVEAMFKFITGVVDAKKRI